MSRKDQKKPAQRLRIRCLMLDVRCAFSVFCLPAEVVISREAHLIVESLRGEFFLDSSFRWNDIFSLSSVFSVSSVALFKSFQNSICYFIDIRDAARF